MNRKTYRGTPISPGIAIGPAFVSDSAAIKIPVYYIDKGQIESELARFHASVEVAKRQIENMIGEMESKLGAKDAMIFKVHIISSKWWRRRFARRRSMSRRR